MRPNMTESEYAAVLKRHTVRGPQGRAPRSDTPAHALNGPAKSAAVAGVRLASQTPSLYRSKLEAAWANSLEMAKRAGEIEHIWYEPMSFKLAQGKRYRPDFMVLSNGRITFYEVKGNWTKNKRDGLTHLAWTAQLYPMFTWVLVTRQRGVWVEKVIG